MSGENKYISLQEIRLFLLDRDGGDNFLLDDREFGDEQISMAMQMTLDRYNSQTPIGVDVHTVSSFPWRHEFVLGVTAILLRMRALNMMRNNLDWNDGGGIAVNEKSNTRDYLALAASMQKEFEDRIGKIKQHINIEDGYGSLGSPYSRLRYYASVS